MRRSLLPFLGDALSWLTQTAAIKDIKSIRTRVNQLLATQNNQQEALVHIISLLNVTRYATQVNRQCINIIMDTVDRTHQDVVTLYNITSSLYNILSYQQIMLHICSIHYIIWEKSPCIQWIMQMQPPLEYFHLMYYQWKMQLYIEEILPLTMHLPVSLGDTLHFYRYLHTYILIADE